MILKPVLIEPMYLPPVAVFALWYRYGSLVWEQHAHYVKGSYRNRCHLAGPNGLLRLSIPLHKGKNQHTPMRKVRISYDHPWQKEHWQSLCSAYRRSPYFEYFEPELKPFYEKTWETLLEFNLALLQWITAALQWDYALALSETFESRPPDMDDYRDRITPRHQPGEIIPGYRSPRYRQVFEDRTGFLPGLSIADLLFNEGPGAASLIRQSIR